MHKPDPHNVSKQTTTPLAVIEILRCTAVIVLQHGAHDLLRINSVLNKYVSEYHIEDYFAKIYKHQVSIRFEIFTRFEQIIY